MSRCRADAKTVQLDDAASGIYNIHESKKRTIMSFGFIRKLAGITLTHKGDRIIGGRCCWCYAYKFFACSFGCDMNAFRVADFMSIFSISRSVIPAMAQRSSDWCSIAGSEGSPEYFPDLGCVKDPLTTNSTRQRLRLTARNSKNRSSAKLLKTICGYIQLQKYMLFLMNYQWAIINIVHLERR
jgi:hypothetical protein